MYKRQRYDFIPGQSLYNRCHLIAWSLCGENANRKNLLTGTRYLNETGMLPFEEQVLNYIRETGNHVLYRVTPMYNEEELVCRGVRLEAQSVEDHGKTLCFHVYCYNPVSYTHLDVYKRQIKANSRHGHHDKELRQLLDRRRNGCRKLKHRGDYARQHKMCIRDSLQPGT